jgi:uncharacterized membrane protein YhhN
LQALFAKTVVSILFLCTALTALLTPNAPLSWGVPVLAGLIFGLVGDIFLDCRVIYPNDASTWQWGGMTSFTIGHLFFLLAIFTNMPQTSGNIALTVAVPLIIGIALSCATTFAGPAGGLDYGKFKPLVLIYGAVGLFMTALAIALAIAGGGEARFVVMGIGAFLFLASDFVLSKEYFGGGDFINSKPLIIVNHLLYYIGQFLIALTILF